MEKVRRLENKKTSRGVALLYVILTVGFLVAISGSAIAIAYQQVALSAYNTSSLKAYYASESGAECGLYWDVAQDVFNPTNSSYNVRCNGIPNSDDPSDGLSTIEVAYPDGSRSEIRIDKRNSAQPTIRSFGYNTDAASGQAQIERGINLTYSQNVDEQLPKNDIVLVFDRSGSVGPHLDDMIQAATTTIESLNDPESDPSNPETLIYTTTGGIDVIRVALITFSYDATLFQDFSTDKALLLQKIEGVTTYGRTNLAGSLIVASSTLRSGGRDVEDTKYVVVITDGLANECSDDDGNEATCPSSLDPETQAWEASTNLRADNVKVVGVGVGINSDYATKLENNMVSVGSVYDASSDNFEEKEMYFDADNFDELKATMEGVVKSILFDISRTGFERQEL